MKNIKDVENILEIEVEKFNGNEVVNAYYKDNRLIEVSSVDMDKIKAHSYESKLLKGDELLEWLEERKYEPYIMKPAKDFNVKRGYTHSGMFHADEVMATALLLLINPEMEIKRVK